MHGLSGGYFGRMFSSQVISLLIRKILRWWIEWGLGERVVYAIGQKLVLGKLLAMEEWSRVVEGRERCIACKTKMSSEKIKFLDISLSGYIEDQIMRKGARPNT